MSDLQSQVILSRHQAIERVQQWKSQGLRVVMTNGCFDLLHPGHLRSLEFSRRQGDKLVVAVNDDESVRRLKGPKRPILPVGIRSEMLAGVRWVDVVVPFPEDSAEEIVKLVMPDIYLKSGDYQVSSTPEGRWVLNLGGDVAAAPYFEEFSSSLMIESILSRYCEDGGKS